MMQGNTEKKKGAVIAAIVIIAIVLLFVGGLAMLLLGLGEEDRFADGIAWLYIAGGGAVVIGVLIALKQRLGELRRGEEEEAKKY